jgi:glycosyltransferase involved in cell wall biosynthesis
VKRIVTDAVSKRTAFVCFSHSLGGLELTTLRLAKAINERGNPSVVIAPPSSPLLKLAAEAGLAVGGIAPRLKYGDVPAALRLRKILRDNRTQVAILTQSKDLHLAALASKGIPELKIAFYQQMDSGYNKRDLLHTWVFSKLVRWFTLTEGMKKNVITHTRVPERRVEVVPLGIDLERFNPKKHRKSAARKALGLPAKGTLVGVMGRLDPQKGQEVLLRAAPALLKKHTDLHIVVAGDETAGEPGYRSYLERLSGTLSLRSRVTFLPFTRDVPQFMSALDVLVLPSFAETYGLVIIEAMAMGCPVVATNAGGVPEIINDEETGLLVSPRNQQELTEALSRILSSFSLRARIVKSARSKALSCYDFNLTVDRLLRSISSF